MTKSRAPKQPTSFKSSSTGGHAAAPPGLASAHAKRTPEEQLAEIERVAREHGANLSEEGFNEALKKVTGRVGQKR